MGGQIVSIPSSNIALDSMHGEIKETIAYTRTYADEMRVRLTTALEELKNTVGNYAPQLENVDTTIPTIDQPSFPNAPVLHGYTASCLTDNLVAVICDNIINGGNGLTVPVYNAIIAREQEARRRNRAKEYRKAISAVGAMGFNLPSGHVAAVVAELSAEGSAQDQDSLNNLLIKELDMSTANRRFFMELGVDLEKSMMDAWVRSSQVTVDKYKVETEGVASRYKALVGWMEAEVSRIKLEVELNLGNARIGLDAYNSMTLLGEKVAESIANIAAQSIASSLGAIKTSLGNSYTGNETRSERWGHDENLTENYKHKEIG